MYTIEKNMQKAVPAILIAIDVPAKLVNGRTLVPIRAITEEKTPAIKVWGNKRQAFIEEPVYFKSLKQAL